MKSLRVTASGNAISGAPIGSRIRGVALAGGSAASSAILFDSTTQAGNQILRIQSLANDYQEITFPNETGLQLDIALSVTLTGTGAELYLFLD